jgi:hypothetical protein
MTIVLPLLSVHDCAKTKGEVHLLHSIRDCSSILFEAAECIKGHVGGREVYMHAPKTLTEAT